MSYKLCRHGKVSLRCRSSPNGITVYRLLNDFEIGSFRQPSKTNQKLLGNVSLRTVISVACTCLYARIQRVTKGRIVVASYREILRWANNSGEIAHTAVNTAGLYGFIKTISHGGMEIRIWPHPALRCIN